jgi:hypothetical protein
MTKTPPTMTPSIVPPAETTSMLPTLDEEDSDSSDSSDSDDEDEMN